MKKKLRLRQALADIIEKPARTPGEHIMRTLARLIDNDPEHIEWYLRPICDQAMRRSEPREQQSAGFADFDPAAFETRLVPRADPEAVNHGGSNGVTAKA